MIMGHKNYILLNIHVAPTTPNFPQLNLTLVSSLLPNIHLNINFIAQFVYSEVPRSFKLLYKFPQFYALSEPRLH